MVRPYQAKRTTCLENSSNIAECHIRGLGVTQPGRGSRRIQHHRRHRSSNVKERILCEADDGMSVKRLIGINEIPKDLPLLGPLEIVQ